MDLATDLRDRIFETFSTIWWPGAGIGQGLAICQSIIVTKHGGQIPVESEDGIGTTFTVQLPAALQEAA